MNDKKKFMCIVMLGAALCTAVGFAVGWWSSGKLAAREYNARAGRLEQRIEEQERIIEGCRRSVGEIAGELSSDAGRLDSLVARLRNVTAQVKSMEVLLHCSSSDSIHNDNNTDSEE